MTLKYIWRSFSLSCHFHVHFSYPWHAFASHGLPATADLLVPWSSWFSLGVMVCLPVQYIACFGILLSPILSTCPSHLSLLSLMMRFNNSSILSVAWPLRFVLCPSRIYPIVVAETCDGLLPIFSFVWQKESIVEKRLHLAGNCMVGSVYTICPHRV